MSYPLRLTGDQVVLREFAANDLDAVHALVADDRVTQSLSFDSRSLEQARAMLAGTLARARADQRTEYYLAVTAHDRLVGFARLALSGVRAAKLGYAIAADEWGQGYGTDAARTLIGYAFEHLDLHRVTAAVGPANSSSLRLLERLGFVQEGRLRDHVFTHGAWRDSVLLSVLEHEWSPALHTSDADGWVTSRG